MKALTLILFLFSYMRIGIAQTAKDYERKGDSLLVTFSVFQILSTHTDSLNCKQAIWYFSKAIDLNPSDIDAYYDRAYTEYYFGEYLNALLDFNKFISLNPRPGDGEPFLMRGNTKLKLNDYNGAINDYNEGLVFRPGLDSGFRDEIYRHIGKAYMGLKDYKNAMIYFSGAIDDEPTDIFAYYERGTLKGLLGDYRGAINDYTKVIEIDPNSGDAYFDRGLAEIIIGNEEAACSDWSKAGESGVMKAYNYIKKYCN